MAGGFIYLDNETISQWPEPNFVNPKLRGWLLAYSIPITVLTSAIVFSRLWSQAKKSTDGLGIDDALCSIGWVRQTLKQRRYTLIFIQIFSVFLTIAIAVGDQHFGFERHIWDVPRMQYNGAAFVRTSKHSIWPLH